MSINYRFFFLLLLCCIFFISLPVVSAEEPEVISPNDIASCLACHSENVNEQHFNKSAHGRLNCQRCHEGINTFPHDEHAVAKKPACKSCHAIKTAFLAKSVHKHADSKSRGILSCQVCHGTNAHEVPVSTKLTPAEQLATCTNCHRVVVNKLSSSAHGQNGNKANGTKPNCFFCHGDDPHQISSPSAINSAPQDQSCRTCHVDIAKKFLRSAHGQMPAESSNRLSCLTCHGSSAHTVQQTKQSSAAETSQQCATCHPKVAQSLASSAHNQLALKGNQQAPTCVACHGDDMHTVSKASEVTLEAKDQSCKTCHTKVAGVLAKSVHGHDGAGKNAPNCLSCHWGSAHKIQTSVSMDRQQQEKSCISCHKDLAKSLENSVHNRPDVKPGDHPSCLSCHGGIAHNIAEPKQLTPQERIKLCSSCHDNKALMARYGMNTDAVSSYDQSFHGRAVMHFGKKNTATCTDCHGLHGVLAPDNRDAPTNPRHVAKTCGKCHADSKMNFALSGANHLRLRIKNSPLLMLEEFLFQLLILGTMFALLGMVILDLRRKAFYHGSSPEAGKLISIFIALSFTCLVVGIILSFLNIPGAGWLWIASVGLIGIAMLIFVIKKKLHPHEPAGKRYQRFNLVMRIQHGLLALTFTLLVLTGLPLHFADVGWLHYVLVLFGGFDGARIVHRVAGVIMVVNWFWHLAYLIYLWKKVNFSLKSWSMLPTKKDVRDFIDNIKYGLGKQQDPPRYDRFQFREKFDYYADMWGTIVMGLTGFILWFPTTLGNHLPNLAFGVSYIAHSYEGLLAMMAIIIWHFYNTHFNPDTFPMNATFLTGTMSESEMEREHPLEKQRIDAAENNKATSDATPEIPTK